MDTIMDMLQQVELTVRRSKARDLLLLSAQEWAHIQAYSDQSLEEARVATHEPNDNRWCPLWATRLQAPRTGPGRDKGYGKTVERAWQYEEKKTR